MDNKMKEYVKKNMMRGMSSFEQEAWFRKFEELGLDPFTKEIMFIQGQPYITRDGLLKIARRIEPPKSITYIVYYKVYTDSEEEKFTIIQADPQTGLPPEVLTQQFDEIEVYAVVCRVERSSGVFEGYAWLEDYSHKMKSGKGFSPWKTSAYTMLTVRALTKALKIAYQIGMTSVEEVAELKAIEMDVETTKGSSQDRAKLLDDVVTYIKDHTKNAEEESQWKKRFSELVGSKIKDASLNQLKEAFESLKKELK